MALNLISTKNHIERKIATVDMSPYANNNPLFIFIVIKNC